MWDSGRHDIRLVGMLRKPWGISAVTCNSGLRDTSSGHRIGLPRVSTV